MATPHPEVIVTTKLSHVELFGMKDTSDTRCRKRNLNARDTSVINQYLSDIRNSCMNEDEKPVTADNIDLLEEDGTHQEAIRGMLRKNEAM